MVATSTVLVRDIEPAPYLRTMQQLTSYAEVDEVLRSRHFIQGSHRESAAFFARSLLMIDDDEHFERRRLESALFSKAALEHYEGDALVPHIDAVIAWAAAQQRGPDGIVRADLVPMLQKILARITAAIGGIDGVDDEASTDRFIHYVWQLAAGSTVEWSTEDHDEMIARILALREDFVAEFYAPSLERRRTLLGQLERGEITEQALPLDLLMLLCQNWQADWDEELPLRELTFFNTAATQTTTHTAPHLIRHLDAWFADHPEDRPLLKDPKFLKAAAYESIRLHLPVPALLRIAKSDVTLSSGRKIASGERVACCFTPANRDVQVFGDDARDFNPRRDTGSVKPWGLSFGGGPHMCIGRALVTGLSARTDGTEGTEGTIVRILNGLYNAGIEVDPDDEPQYTAASHHDAYERFPIRLTSL